MGSIGRKQGRGESYTQNREPGHHITTALKSGEQHTTKQQCKPPGHKGNTTHYTIGNFLSLAIFFVFFYKKDLQFGLILTDTHLQYKHTITHSYTEQPKLYPSVPHAPTEQGGWIVIWEKLFKSFCTVQTNET